MTSNVSPKPLSIPITNIQVTELLTGPTPIVKASHGTLTWGFPDDQNQFALADATILQEPRVGSEYMLSFSESSPQAEIVQFSGKAGSTLNFVQQAQRANHIALNIGTDAPGAQSLELRLLVSSQHQQITGYGRLSQAINPPLNLQTKVEGSYSALVMGSSTQLVVTMTGYPPSELHGFHGSHGPVVPANLNLRMTIDQSWKQGVATYSYRTAVTVPWRDVNSVPVKQGSIAAAASA